MPKVKKTVLCPCGEKDQELERDEDGDWVGFCGKCGRNLGRSATRAELAGDQAFFNKPPEPEKKAKKGWLD